MSVEPLEDLRSPEGAASAPHVDVHRWRRWGHDRAYVRRGGEDIGFRDLRTGEINCTDPGERETVAAATAAMHAKSVDARRAAAYRPRHQAPDAERPALAAARELLPDRDLALNRAGEAARAMSRELLAQAPTRLLIARAVGMKTDERNWHVGAQGEEEAGRRLSTLGSGWRVLHAVPVGDRGSDIDHVVVGPAGVFTINVKNHPQCTVWTRGDTAKVNGRNQPWVRNSRHEARRAAALLSAVSGTEVRVRGVVAVAGAERGLTVKDEPADVSIVALRELVWMLRRLPTVLDHAAVRVVFDAARHLSTWQPTRVARGDLDRPA